MRIKIERQAEEPWQTRHWAASQHNFADEIAVPVRPVALHDITIRDGEEVADLVYSVEDKVRIAQALSRAGVKRTELFLTVPGWLESVRAILATCPEMALYVTWQPGRVERALDLGVRHVMVWYRIGEVWQEVVSKASRDALMERMLAEVRAAREAGARVNLFMPELSRASLEHILAACRAAEGEGATAATVVDSQGVARPAAIRYLVEQIKQATRLEVEVHCHNDFGLATANVLAAYEGGADALHVTVNGMGYRAGNASLEETVMGLEVLYGVDTGVELDRLPELSRLVEEITGIAIGHLKPVVGRGTFAYEQWGSIAAFTRAGKRPYAFPYEPEVVGRRARLAIGKWSDSGAVIQKLAEYGMGGTPEQVDRILVRSQRTSVARRRPLKDDEFLRIAEDEGATSVE